MGAIYRVFTQAILFINQEDKQKHFIVSLLLVLFFSFFLNIWSSVIVSTMIGLLKEVWDEFFGSGFCVKDLVANGLGIAVGIFIVFIFQSFVF